MTRLRPLTVGDVEAVVALSLEAWAPVFASVEGELGTDVYRLVYPDWRAAQAEDVAAACRAEEHDAWVAVDAGDRPVGFVVLAEDQEGGARVGEIHMLAVAPQHQRAGVATRLLQHAIDEARSRGLDLVVLGTGGDPGHAPARALYERNGFTAFRQVRYYRRP